MYLALVQERARESGHEMDEIAAGAARLASGDKPLLAAVEPEPVVVSAPPEDGMVRLFMNLGRKSGLRPNDIVGAIANKAGIPGRAIGAIDIYDHVAFVEIPTEYVDQVLSGMRGVRIRNQSVALRVATPEHEAASSMEQYPGRSGKRPYGGKMVPTRGRPPRDSRRR